MTMRFPRLCALLLLGLSPATASEVVDVPCRPLAVVSAEGGYRALSHDEWIAMRVAFWMAPHTPSAFPPGDRGIIRENADGTGFVEFIDGEEACAKIGVGGDALAILKGLRDGEITHPPGKM